MKNEFTLEFTNGETINIGTMFCIGQNYAKHIKEMGGIVTSDPTVFIKPPQALITDNEKIVLPDFSENVHHEVELVVVIGKDCDSVEPDEAIDYVAGFAVGIDVTLRDIQNNCKTNGKPWAVAKGFRTSAPISKIVPLNQIPSDMKYFDLELKVNGEIKQKGTTQEMERTVEELISYLSKVFSLRTGDIIFTGTPEGVGKINSGDTLTIDLSGLVSMTVLVA